MRTRLIVIMMVLLVAPLALASVAAARALASANQQKVFVDRLRDTARLADLAEQAVTTVDRQELEDQMSRYSNLYGIGIELVDRHATVQISSGMPPPASDTAIRQPLTAALVGHEAREPAVIWPWQDRPLVVAVPVMRGGDVAGAIVTTSPSGALRSALLTRLVSLVGAGALLLLLGTATINALANWVLQPVYTLDAVAAQLGRGKFSARAEKLSGPRELRQLTASFNDMVTRLADTLARQATFVADASHQLRTPLGSLMLGLDELELGLDPDRRATVAEISTEVGRLSAILDGLLRLANAEHTHMPRAAVDLTMLVGERVEAWRPYAAVASVVLHGPGTVPEPIVAAADDLLLGSALDAVIDNAIKFSPAGGSVAVALTTDTDEAVVMVADTGEGLMADELERIGDRFWRSRRHQNVRGCGLGLAVVRSVLDDMGGRIAFTANEPSGLSVIITVPCHFPVPDDVPPVAMSRPTFRRRPRSILPHRAGRQG